MKRPNTLGRERGKLPIRTWRIVGVLSLIGAEALLYGYSYPFFSLALEKRELAVWLIGLNASLASVGILFLGPILPTLIHRFGVKHVVVTLFAVSFLAFGAILVADFLTVWFVARFVMGACFAALWTTTEIWLNDVVDDRHRGRIIGASGTLYATCQFLGPLLLGTVGVAGSLPLIAAMAPLAVGVAVALSIRPSESNADDDDGHGDTRHLRLALTLAGGLVVSALLCGIGETAMQSLLPLYGLAHGLDDAGAARLVAVFSLGEAVLVAGLGWMADRYGRRLTLRLCVLVATISTAAIPFTAGTATLLWPVLFFAGGTVAGIYTLGIVLIGQDFRGQTLAVVSTGFAMAYSAGSIVGSAPVGYLIDLFGPEALPVSVAIGFLGLSTYLLVYDGGDRDRSTMSESRPVPSLTYLEDSAFDDDETSVSEQGVELEVTDSIESEPEPASTVPERALVPTKHVSEDDLNERFKLRSIEISQIVAKRDGSSRASQSKPLSDTPTQGAGRLAPPPRSDDGG